MARRWLEVPIRNKYFANVDQDVLTSTQAAQENLFHNESGGLSRFPGLVSFAELPDNGRVFLTEWRGHMIAVTDEGRLYEIDENANIDNKTSVPIAGDRRVHFDRTSQELLMAAGNRIFTFDGNSTEVLSTDAPLTTHVGFIDSYVVALELESGRFQHSDPGVATSWPALNIFSADSRPDNATALLITEFNEMYIAGPETIEQWERLASGTTPFFRRWGVGEGVLAPYTLVFADNAAYVVNKDAEFTRISGQVGQVASEDVQKILEAVSDWDQAWAAPMNVLGQKFILLQIPEHTNVYGTKGLTLVYDSRQRRWFTLYDWDADLALPANWPGHSYLNLWSRHFVGCDGRVCEMKFDTFSNEGRVQRALLRTAHLDQWGAGEIVGTRMRVKRGVGSNTVDPKILLRCQRDNRRWTRQIERGLGKQGKGEMFLDFGPMGYGSTFMFETMVTADAQLEIMKLEIQFEADG